MRSSMDKGSRDDGGAWLISAKVAPVSVATGFRHKLLIILAQMQARMSGTTSGFRPAAAMASFKRATTLRSSPGTWAKVGRDKTADGAGGADAALHQGSDQAGSLRRV